MQLGTRWPVGGNTPAGLPSAVVAAITAEETQLAADGVDVAAWHWTLTWLERKPIVELDDGTAIRYDPTTDAATVTRPDDETEPGDA